MIEVVSQAPPCCSPERIATVTRSARRLHLARPPHAAATSEVRSRSLQEEAECPDPEDLQEIQGSLGQHLGPVCCPPWPAECEAPLLLGEGGGGDDEPGAGAGALQRQRLAWVE